jgi:hypothetical protein
MRPLPRTILFLAASLLAASLLSWGLMQSIREPEVYDPRGGPLAVDGLWIGMTYDEVVQATGQRPAGFLSNIIVEHVIPGYRLETGVGFEEPEGGSLEDATVGSIAGNVLTQDGRILLDFHSVSRWNPPKTSDIMDALGRPNSWDGNYYYRLEGVDLTIIDPGRYSGMVGRFRLISLNRRTRPAPPPSAQPTPPDPEGSPKQ